MEILLSLSLQAQFKQETGVDYKPGMAPPTSAPATAPTSPDSASCPFTRVAQQGELVRKLKSEQAPKVQFVQLLIMSIFICLSSHCSCPHPFVQSAPTSQVTCPFIDIVLSRVLIRRPVKSRVQSRLSDRSLPVSQMICPVIAHVICMPVKFILNHPQQ